MVVRKRFTNWISAVSFFLFFFNSAFAHNYSWQKITVPPEKYTVRINGAKQDIYPGCAFPGSEYAFYFKPGRQDKLVVFFNGGGACWNHTTCVTSLSTPLPAYVPSINAPGNSPQDLKGIFNLQNKDNPFDDWNMLFLPYCTGDVHIGSKDTTYVSNIPNAPAATIRHRGFDNFAYAQNWLRQNHRHFTPEKLVVAGVSAGAYGATLNYPYIREMFSDAKSYLLADSGIGAITSNFIDVALREPDAAWGVQKNLSPVVPGFGILPYVGGNSFSVLAHSLLTSHYQRDKFSVFTSAWDVVQTTFLSIMQNPDNIQQWSNLTPQLLGTWAIKARQITALESSASNYRFNIMPGCLHTILGSDRLYSTTNQGVPFIDWVRAATTGKSHRNNQADWKNLSCVVGVDCPPPQPAEVLGCLQAPATN